MLIKIHPKNPDMRQIGKVIQTLKNGGVIVFPTDTVYALGCDAGNSKAVQRICQLKGIPIEKSKFSFICYDLSNISEYAKHINTPTFKLMRKYLPGPYTFILNASSGVPDRFFGGKKKKTIGIRIPDNEITRIIIKELQGPLMATSVHDEDEIIDYITDPELIYEKYSKMVDMVIDGGTGGNEPSTILDCTNDEIQLIRQGKGEIDL